MPFGVKNPFDKIQPPELPGLPAVLEGDKKKANRKEILQLLSRVDIIEADCLAQSKEDAFAAERDDFIRLKKLMYITISDTKMLLRQRHEIQQQRGNTVEAIQKSAKVKDLLSQLDQDFMKLKEVFKKQTKQRATIGDDELDARFKDVQIIKRQMEECKALSGGLGQFSDEEILTLTDFASQMRQEGVELPKQSDRQLLEVEQEAMGRWAERDKKLDEGLEEVGDVVTRLGEIAVNIGEKADQQAKAVETLNLQANEANEELVQINDRIKSLLTGKNGANLCCKVLLAMILTGQIGYLISVFYNMAKSGLKKA